MNWRKAFAHLTVAALSIAMAGMAVAAGKYKDPDPRELRRLNYYLVKKDCPGVVTAMKEGIKARQPDVLLAAAGFFEEGICVKADWDKAVNLYQLAEAAGSRSATWRLVSGFAVAGRDNGRALWYAAQLSHEGLEQCLPTANPLTDPDGFNAALERMPAALFKACVYMVGVSYEVKANAQYPREALDFNVQADIGMEFTPAKGAIKWGYIQEPAELNGTRSPTLYQDERKIQNGLLTYLTKIGEAALARYTKPDGIDPSTVLKCTFSFSIS
jgi:hypothetical protein